MFLGPPPNHVGYVGHVSPVADIFVPKCEYDVYDAFVTLPA